MTSGKPRRSLRPVSTRANPRLTKSSIHSSGAAERSSRIGIMLEMKKPCALKKRWLSSFALSVRSVMRRNPFSLAKLMAYWSRRSPNLWPRCSLWTTTSSSTTTNPPSAVLMVKSRLSIDRMRPFRRSTKMRPRCGSSSRSRRPRVCFMRFGSKSSSCVKRSTSKSVSCGKSSSVAGSMISLSMSRQACQDFLPRHAIAEFAKGLAGLLLGIEHPQEFVDEDMHVFRDDLAFQQLVEAALVAQAPAYESVVGVDHLAVDLGARAAEADVGYLVLAATRRAAAEVDANLVLVPAARLLELLD